MDNVNHPSHYSWLKDKCGIEPIDIIRYFDFNLGNALKYIMRCNHKSDANMSDKEFFSLTCVQLLDMLDDQTLKDIAADKLYPGNTYAFDSYSDSEIYTINDEGKLVEVNIVEEPGFIEAFKKALRKDAEWTDEWEKNHKNEE